MGGLSVSFLAFGDRNLASSRFRAWDVADAWGVPCTVWDETDNAITDVVVLQKVYPRRKSHYAAHLKEWLVNQNRNGRRIVWDLCDPVWWWMHEAQFRDLLNLMALVTVSSRGLQEDLQQEYGHEAILIRDRLPYQDGMRKHTSVEVPTLIWFGYARNRMPCLAAASLTLERLLRNNFPFELCIVDEAPDYHLITDDLAEHTSYVRWQRDSFWDVLTSADIALLPEYPGLWGKMKSENKIITAWWAGLPVSDATDYRRLVSLMTDWQLREAIGRENRERAEKDYPIQTSVEEWQALVSRL